MEWMYNFIYFKKMCSQMNKYILICHRGVFPVTKPMPFVFLNAVSIMMWLNEFEFAIYL